jgi:hypothetical protein
LEKKERYWIVGGDEGVSLEGYASLDEVTTAMVENELNYEDCTIVKGIEVHVKVKTTIEEE